MSESSDRLAENRSLWERKPGLRTVYGDFYRRIRGFEQSGGTLEIGGGTGNFKDHAPSTVCFDLVPTPHVDGVADAHQMPVTDGSVSNIVMIDVLHHLAQPLDFFAEARRVLRPGGRIIAVEPAITLGSKFFYDRFHPEPVDMRADVLAGETICSDEPFDSNQAVPTLLAKASAQRMAAAVPGLQVVAADWFGLLAYPLSGGLRPWSLVPSALMPALVRFDNLLARVLGRQLGFRLLLVFEKPG